MLRQGTINSLCREFPNLAEQIQRAGARIKADRSREETLYEFRGPALSPRTYRLYISAFAEPNIPGDTIMWLSDEGCGN